MSGSLLKFEKKYSVKIGGRRYPVVKIGNQLWMAQNLDWKFEYNGGTLPIGGSDQPRTPHAWYYNNKKSTYGIDGTYKCGLMYNWYAAKYLDDNKSTLLPDGWHVPNKTEWDALIAVCGGTSAAGPKLKALDNSITSSWPSGWNGTDDYNFSLLPGGYYDGGFYGFNVNIRVWTVDEDSSTKAYDRVFSNSGSISLGWIYKMDADYVRLVKSLT
jgi:uncharacterized protein (TIGR02145 family)